VKKVNYKMAIECKDHKIRGQGLEHNIDYTSNAYFEILQQFEQLERDLKYLMAKICKR
jgi:hypothetical protein